ncbi:MAG: hypothetical protein HQM16_12205 [Deltaproteobacteria bacterium]|nr:hypothetical protein [Deltaproteobacteria bacterium]
MKHLLDIIKSKFGLALLFIVVGLMTLIFFRQSDQSLIKSTFTFKNQGLSDLQLHKSAFLQNINNAANPHQTASYDIVDAHQTGGANICVCPICRQVTINTLTCESECPRCQKTMMHVVYAGEGHMSIAKTAPQAQEGPTVTSY